MCDIAYESDLSTTILILSFFDRHLDNRVFASLANGDIIIYRRDLSGGWNVAERQIVSISNAAAPVTKMMAVAGKLWCAAMNTVRVLSTVSLQVEVSRHYHLSVKVNLQAN